MNNLLRPNRMPAECYNSILQLIAPVTGIFLLAFAADSLVQKMVELFLAAIAEQDTFFL